MKKLTYKDLIRKYEHSGKILICCPRWRETKSRRVVSWLLVTAVDSVDAAREALKSLDMEKAVAISTTERITISDDLAARYFRVFFGLQ